MRTWVIKIDMGPSILHFKMPDGHIYEYMGEHRAVDRVYWISTKSFWKGLNRAKEVLEFDESTSKKVL